MKLLNPARLAICTLIVCVLLYFFPLFRISKLGSSPTSALDSKARSVLDTASPKKLSSPDVTTYIEKLWTDRLPEAAGNAASVDEVLAMAAADPARARQEYGREVGLGGPTFFFLRGRGRIESVDQDECLVIIEGQSQPIVLEIGILLGNAVRDATGLVNVGEFPNSQEFNRLSAELNERCESQVIRPVRDFLVVGTHVKFVGCGEVRNNKDFDPLKLIPVQLTVLNPAEQIE
ncbi:DUF2291 family protein [Bythopirellula goksoeyrii]|uniref:Periplasmic lipoprotein n=1 Tax=Bythopirellula goksoeyrii TaxID=1400387 RepID=A0A5B9QJ08_9BACT|nr:DUF2291 family protein [Bythopirellula goksoeyrii]QEG34161.1 hypothetical protein Pr1d_14340 [Bythopirellula goksoeyrii]